MKNTVKLRFAGALAAGLALAAAGLGGVASGAVAARGPQADATIRIVGDTHGRLKFKGPDSVDEDSLLRVVNKTNPNQVGPHTFSLVRHRTYPQPSEQRDCERLEPGFICTEIAEWHDVFSQNPQNVVDVKRPGWDKLGDFQEKGDSWFAEGENDQDIRSVTKESGKLRFICAVHPGTMRGDVDVIQFPPTKP